MMHAAGIIFENQNGEILLLQRDAVSLEPLKWGLAGGLIEPGEDPVDGVIREAIEETGFEIDKEKLRFIKTFNWNINGNDITFDVYSYQIENDQKIEIQLSELVDSQWIRPEAASQRDDLMEGMYPILKEVFKNTSEFNNR